MKAEYQKYILNFKQPCGTSRGVLNTKETYFLKISHQQKTGIGECGIFMGLSYDDVPEYEEKLQWLCLNITQDIDFLKNELNEFPSILFGLEQSLLNLNQKEGVYFENDFSNGNAGIPINGLIWMGSIDFMQTQIKEKLKQGFRCLKLKIGVDWENEQKILKTLRKQFPKTELELRVDANGAFNDKNIWQVLEDLHLLEIHSIEQPIKVKNWDKMSEICKKTPIPIALDEELIGINHTLKRIELLDVIQPQYIILKPSLLGGFSICDEWISFAEKRNIGWWITSALESNIGLNAIAQYTYSKKTNIPQGLGTGGLFTNNIPSDLKLIKDHIWLIN